MNYKKFKQFMSHLKTIEIIYQYLYSKIQSQQQYKKEKQITYNLLFKFCLKLQSMNKQEIGVMAQQISSKIKQQSFFRNEWEVNLKDFFKMKQLQRQEQVLYKFKDIFLYKSLENDIKQVVKQINEAKNIKTFVAVSHEWWQKFKYFCKNKYDIQFKDKFSNNYSAIEQTSNNTYKNVPNQNQSTVQFSKQVLWPGQIQYIRSKLLTIKQIQSHIRISDSLFEKLKIIFGQIKLVQFIFYNYDKEKCCQKSFKCVSQRRLFSQIKEQQCKEEEQICYMRHVGRQWQYITPMYKDKVNQYCTDTCFVVILKESDNESFQKNVVQSKEPTIGDIYTVRHKQQKDCDICVMEHTENGQVKCRILDNQRETVITHSKQQLSKHVKRNISMEQVSIESKFGGGLTNLGNTCYMNSVVQIILHLRILNLFNQEKPFGRILKDIAKKIQNHNTSMLPTDLKKFVDKQMSRFAGYDQQDAHQFLIAAFQRFSEQNRSVIDEYFTGQTQRTLTCPCPECNHIERIKDTANVFSIPIQDSGLNVKILFIDNDKHSMIEFRIKRGATVKQWFSQFQSAADIDHKKHEYAVFNVKMGKIDEQYFPNSLKNYLDLKIDDSDLIVAYSLNKTTQINSKNTKSQINNESKQNNGLKNSPSIIQNTSKATLIKVLNYDQTYYEYMNYPFCFKLHPQQFIHAIRRKIQQIVGFKKNINIKVFKKNTQDCYFCQKYCLDSKCFDANSHKVALDQLDNLVTYVIEWKSQKDYNQHIIPVKQQKRQEINQQMDLQKSLTKMKKIERVQFDCEKCNHNQLDSSQIILNTPIILFFQLKRFIARNKNIIKLHTKWNLQYDIELCGHNYKLRGVILHLGQTTDSGHYIAVIDGIKYDDQWVQQFNFDMIDTSQIFILVYQRVLK